MIDKNYHVIQKQRVNNIIQNKNNRMMFQKNENMKKTHMKKNSFVFINENKNIIADIYK